MAQLSKEVFEFAQNIKVANIIFTNDRVINVTGFNNGSEMKAVLLSVLQAIEKAEKDAQQLANKGVEEENKQMVKIEEPNTTTE